ncbi:coiled-coil domain-containing protein 113 isoform X1 [Ornithorhynchus anatinus]|uniref:coiled-coil domain-containing protein 113 isoform X1 n=1 Tax=Ornithorhynchus anatinus TaxID=9258 RepID=UPI0010A8B326|nr:coiled-coil domain-containing protein 113 isoform X1 [Ornithorhynchus anatinus]
MASLEEDTESVRTESLIGEKSAAFPVLQLFGVVEDLSYGNATLKIETEMFEKYLNKLEPKDQRGPRMTDFKTSSVDFSQLRNRRKSKSRATAERLIGLTMDQKYELGQRELEETKEEMRQMRANSERDLQNHEAILEEAEIRWAELKKAMQDFDRDILQNLSKKKGSIVATQKIMKYLEDKNHLRDLMKDKLRLKNISLKAQKKKILLHLKQKEEVDEALHEVDFQQLKIENAQFLEKIDERNRELLQLKMTAGNTLQVLNFYKKKLQNAMETSSRLEKEISLKKEMLEKIERETIQGEKERAQAESLNKKLRKQLSNYRVPHVMKYVQETMESYDLEKSIEIWERKVEIAELSLKGYHKTWNQLKMAKQQAQMRVPL